MTAHERVTLVIEIVKKVYPSINTDSDFANAFGLTRGTIVNYQNPDKKEFPIMFAYSANYLFGIDVEWLVNGEGLRPTEDNIKQPNGFGVTETNSKRIRELEIKYQELEEYTTKFLTEEFARMIDKFKEIEKRSASSKHKNVG